MTTVLVNSIIWVCCWLETLSWKQELTYKVGINLCAQRCFITRSCIGIEMDSGQLHCQLIINDAKKRNDNTLSKLYPVAWNGVPHVQCEANQLVVVTRRKSPKCVPVGPSHGVVCKGRHDCRMKNSACFGGVCLCALGLYFSPKQNACLRECDEYGDGMDIYKGAGILDYNDKTLSHTSLTHCCDLCVREKAFTCLTAEWSKEGVCQLSSKGYLDVMLESRQKGEEEWSFAQRRCK